MFAANQPQVPALRYAVGESALDRVRNAELDNCRQKALFGQFGQVFFTGSRIPVPDMRVPPENVDSALPGLGHPCIMSQYHDRRAMLMDMTIN